MIPRARTLLLAVLAALAALLTLAAPAFAHVTVSAPGAVPGGNDQEITFHVPVEENSDTVKFAVQLPTDHPIASVLVRPVPGWTHTEKVSKLDNPIKTDDGPITTAVTQITWTADQGGGIAPGEYGDFTVLAGLLPDVKTLTLPAIQTYANGDVVKWVVVPAPGADEPEDPAPVLTLGASAASAPSAAPAASSSTSTTGPTVLAIVALVVAAGALGVAVVSRSRAASRA